MKPLKKTEKPYVAVVVSKRKKLPIKHKFFENRNAALEYAKTIPTSCIVFVRPCRADDFRQFLT